MTEHDLIQWLLPAIGIVLAYLGGAIVDEIKKMREAMQHIAVDVAVVVTRIESHDKRITKLEENL